MVKKLDVRHAALGRRIKAAIAQQGTNIRGVSKALGLTYESVRRYAGGISKPRPDTLEALAAHLKTTRGYLLDDEDSAAPEAPMAANASNAHPTDEQLERLEDLLKQRHASGFNATVMQRISGRIWSHRIGTSRSADAPQYFVLLGSNLDDLIAAMQ